MHRSNLSNSHFMRAMGVHINQNLLRSNFSGGQGRVENFWSEFFEHFSQIGGQGSGFFGGGRYVGWGWGGVYFWIEKFFGQSFLNIFH